MSSYKAESPPYKIPSDLRLRRVTLGLTQQELAQLAQVSRDYIGRLEQKRHRPSLAIAQRLGAALACSPSDLFPDTQENR